VCPLDVINVCYCWKKRVYKRLLFVHYLLKIKKMFIDKSVRVRRLTLKPVKISSNYYD